MTAPLNLTLQRGPSVWEDRPASWSDDGRVYGVAAGALLAALAMPPRVNRQWLLGLAVGIAGASLLGGRFSSTFSAALRHLRGRGAAEDHLIDRASEDSFPASDPPQYV